MKLYEKQARETAPPMGCPHYFDDAQKLALQIRSLEDGYKQGFFAARALAIKILRMRMCNLYEADWKRLETMGEEEVE